MLQPWPAHPFAFRISLPAGKGGEGPEEQARYLGQQLVRRQLARRVDRAVKKPAPGSKKLVKFPRKLAQLPPGEATVRRGRGGSLPVAAQGSGAAAQRAGHSRRRGRLRGGWASRALPV